MTILSMYLGGTSNRFKYRTSKARKRANAATQTHHTKTLKFMQINTSRTINHTKERRQSRLIVRRAQFFVRALPSHDRSLKLDVDCRQSRLISSGAR